MGKFDKTTYEIIKRLQNARLSLLAKQPFYALLLLHMKFALDLTCETAYTDGVRIAFNPDFINDLSDRELEFVLMHEVLHAALGHPFRKQESYDLECYDTACEIVVNSNILYSLGMDEKQITLKKYGVAPHTTPDGEEGYEHSVEEVYGQLLVLAKKQKKQKNPDDGQSDKGRGIGADSKGEGNGEENASEGKEKSDKPGKSQKGTSSGGGDGEVTEEDLNDLIASLLKGRAVHGKVDPDSDMDESDRADSDQQGTVDDHSFWNGDDEDNTGRDTWLARMVEATDLIASSEGGMGRGTVPLAAERLVEELKNPTLDWKTMLNEFVQEEICDYSFSPPDKRMEDCPFFLPDFNEKDESVKDILFMIDTSGSMSNSQITECYSEIYGAITQFGGRLQGKLGFFDAVVVEPIPFEDEEEFKIIRPKGGGGTSFDIIFDYVEKDMEEPPVSIVILTDGYAPFPAEARAMGIPVLWIINNKEVTPPWGKIARILESAP